jgi:hypothetical protein
MVHMGAEGLTLNAGSMFGFLSIGVFVVRLCGGALGVFFAFFAMSCVGAGLINRAPTLPPLAPARAAGRRGGTGVR